MGRILHWRTFYYLALNIFVFEVVWSSEANGSASLPRNTESHHVASETYSESTTGEPGKGIPRKKSPAGNFSLQIVSFAKVRSTDLDMETFDGFVFVDSPEARIKSSPDPDDEKTGAVERSNSTNIAVDSSGGAIDKNVWRNYKNGTIIHDVHISLVHPADMLGPRNEGNSNVSDTVKPGDPPDSNAKSDHTLEGWASSKPGHGSKQSINYNGNNTEMTPLESVFKNIDVSTVPMPSSGIDSLYSNSSLLPSTVVMNSSAADDISTGSSNGNTISVSVPGQRNSGGKFPPVINLGISINAKGTCLRECLAKCYSAESYASVNQATCSPLVIDSMKEEQEISSDISDETTSPSASVPILKLDEIGMLKIAEPSKPKPGFLLEDICLSESCVLKAADVLNRMDKTVDPCHSFYKFSCGGYLKNDIPDSESVRSVSADISSDILTRMYSVLKSPLLASEPLPMKLLKTFYGKCILTSPKELFLDALRELGGWPSPYSQSQHTSQHNWGEIAFNWTYGKFLEYNLVSINLTFSDEKGEWMLNMDYPWFVKVALNSNSLSVLDEMERDIRKVASALGVDNSTVKSVLVDLRIFMAAAIKYANTTLSSVKREVYSLKDLKTRFIHFDLMKRLPALFETIKVINDNEMIYVSNMMYLEKVDDLLRDSTVRTQAVHLTLTALRTFFVLIGTATNNGMEKYCVKLTGKLFPNLFGHYYSSTFVSSSKVASASRIVSSIKDSLVNILDEIIDGADKEKVIDHVRQVKFVWSNRNEINYDLNGIARSFDENHSFIGFVKTGIWNLKKVTYTYLHQSVNSSVASFIEMYSEDDYSVNAFYYSQHVLIPSSALHEKIFNPNVPPYDSFGGLGLIVAHELLHSVIAAGDISNTVGFRNMEKCLVNQFNKFTKRDSKDRVNGVITKEENFADYGGFLVAYRAFMEWYNHSSEDYKEKRIPALHEFNEKQMFWLMSATNWCEKVSPIPATSVDSHAPAAHRVDGQFANIPDFARDFNCPENSPMNPKERCSLW